MATAPVSRKLNLTRDQLAQFLTDQQQIRQFELLFSTVDAIAPDVVNEVKIEAGSAQATANEALAELARLADAVELLTAAPVIENNNSVVTDYIDFNTTTPVPALKVGRMHWNGGYTLNLEMTPNVNQAIGESQYYYLKATATITKGQLVMFDGGVGSSGVIQGKPATGVTNGQYIMGIAAENIANNAFGLVASFGVVRGFDTTGTPYGEVWADGDILYYNPSYVGGLTKNLPPAPTPHVVVAAVVNAGPAGSGSVFVRVQAEPSVSQLSDVFISGIANGDLLQYDSVQQRWENVPASTLPVGTATNLAGGATGSVPYQSASSNTAMLPIGTALQVLKVNAGATAPQWVSGAALTKVDDTNVTLTLGGTPATSLLAATSLTLGWAGQLATTRGGTGLSSFTANGILYASSTSALATNSAITFDGTNFATTGRATATAFIPSGSSVPTNGMYLSAANTVAISTDTTLRMTIDSVGRVGIGATLLGFTGFRVNQPITAGASTTRGNFFEGTTTASASNNVVSCGFENTRTYDQAGFALSGTLATGGSARGIQSSVVISGATGTVTAASGFVADVRNTGAGTLTNAVGFNAAIFQNTGGGTLTNAFGFRASDFTAATNNYGFYSDIAAATGQWNFVANGTANNAYAGNSRFGGVTAPTVAVDVTGAVLATGNVTGGYNNPAAGTTAMAFGSYNVVKVTPNATATYTSTVPAAGTRCTLIILTSGVTSYTITFGTGFKTTGTLATGVTSARYFMLSFVSDGTFLLETARTVAIA